MAAGEAAGAVPESGPLAALRREFTTWRIFRSNVGRFWATRIGARRPPDAPGWWAMTVDGDTAGDLREALLIQAGSGPG